jgi:hypothetical protein
MLQLGLQDIVEGERQKLQHTETRLHAQAAPCSSSATLMHLRIAQEQQGERSIPFFWRHGFDRSMTTRTHATSTACSGDRPSGHASQLALLHS